MKVTAMRSEDNVTVNKCLKFCQTLVSQGHSISFFSKHWLQLIIHPGHPEGIIKPGTQEESVYLGNQEHDQPPGVDSEEEEA